MTNSIKWEILEKEFLKALLNMLIKFIGALAPIALFILASVAVFFTARRILRYYFGQRRYY